MHEFLLRVELILNRVKVQYFALVMLLSVLHTSKVFSESWSGRVVLGGYASTERFADTSATGSSKNDFQTLSGRFYLKGENLGPGQFESITDLRDKHDFFDKLNKEKLALDARNQFQVRQLSVGLTNPQKFWGFQLRRSLQTNLSELRTHQRSIRCFQGYSSSRRGDLGRRWED